MAADNDDYVNWGNVAIRATKVKSGDVIRREVLKYGKVPEGVCRQNVTEPGILVTVNNPEIMEIFIPSRILKK